MPAAARVAAAVLASLALVAVAQDDGGDAPPRTVRFVTPDGHPVPGVGVAHDGDERRRWDSAGADGIVTLPETLGDGPVELALGDAGDLRSVVAEGPATVVHVEGLPRLEVTVRDALTWAPLTPRAVVVHGRELARDGERFVAPVVAASAGEEIAFSVRVEAPEGYASRWFRPGAPGPASAFHARGPVHSRLATRVVADVPLWREGFVRVLPVDEDGEVVRDVRVDRVATRVRSMGSQSWAWSWSHAPPETQPDGSLLVRDLPLVPGEVFRVQLRDAADRLRGEEFVEPSPTAPGEPVTVTLTTKRGLETAIGIGGGGGGSEEPEEPPSTAGVGTLAVSVRLADGRPGAKCLVRVTWADGRTTAVRADEEGVARFEGILTGEARVTLEEAGVCPAATDVVVGADAPVHAALVEPAPRTIRVAVVERDGTPIPAVSVSLEWDGTLPIVPRDGDAIAFAHLTDADGRVAIHGVPPGEALKVVAVRGTRRASGIITATGDAVRLRLGDPR